MPSYYPTYRQYGNMLSLPINQPQVELDPDTSLVIQTICLKLGQVLKIRLVGVNIVQSFSTVTTITKINSGLPGCYLGFFSGAFDNIRRPSGIPIVGLGLETVGYVQTNPWTYWTISQPDIYSFVLVNNTEERTFEAVVSGSVRVEQALGYYDLFDPDPGAQRTVTAGVDYLADDLTNVLNPLNPTGLTDPSSPNYDPSIIVVGGATAAPGTYIPPSNC